MAAHSHAASLAQIDLTVEGPGNCTPVVYSQRQITLNASNNVIAIGRASKVSAKGFVPAPDNAWFDSAVMSREHAEIRVDMDEKKVQVRDKGSLHGTYLNEHEKLEKEPKELKDGDRLTFGLPVDRGTSRFMPVSVKVGVSFNSPADRYVLSSFASSALTKTFSVGDGCGTSTFQVPDDSEGSSDVDGYTSDNSIYSSNSATMNPHTSSTAQPSVPPRPVPAVDVIDLTGPPTSNHNHNHPWTRTANRASYENSAPTFIDLSSPPSSPLLVRESRDFEYAAYDAPVTTDVDAVQLDIPDVPELVRRISVQDLSSLAAATSRLSDLSSTLEQTAQALEGMERSALDSDLDSNYSSDYSIHDNESELSEAESNLDYPEDPMDSDSSSDDASDSGSDHDMDDQSDRSSALNEDLESLENYSDDGSSVSGDEGMRPYCCPARDYMGANILSGATADDIFDFPRAPSPLLLSPLMEREAPIQNRDMHLVSDGQDDTLNNTISGPTLPALLVASKKDETITKSTSPIAIEKLLNDRPGVARSTITPLPELRNDTQPYLWSDVPKGDFESLGERTGKVDFFAAREANKAYFNKTFGGQASNKAALDTQTTSRPASSVYALCNEPIRSQGPEDASSFPRLPPLTKHSLLHWKANQSIAPDALDHLLFNSVPSESITVQGEVKTKELETEKPITQDAETKESETGKPEAQEVNVPTTVQEAQEPQALVQAEQPKSRPGHLKRKADDISVETVDDLKWSGSTEPATTEAPKIDEVKAATAEAESQVDEASMQLPRTFDRPTKKLRLFRIAERVGIAAIGGAMVMGTLIYTAPTFA
ncbi:hypothetical protein B0T21DRAFT_347135 [Apiosordaria backusii]|uniref:FHA domain-containing protein n=1 Tax=Apiosordaria backusii TaxID=314023 RepID=A0AA40BT76_9PEZI|nr:hypothetical protein B0T21DRAFT_347135 [Apiosordaria backusii]